MGQGQSQSLLYLFPYSRDEVEQIQKSCNGKVLPCPCKLPQIQHNITLKNHHLQNPDVRNTCNASQSHPLFTPLTGFLAPQCAKRILSKTLFQYRSILFQLLDGAPWSSCMCNFTSTFSNLYAALESDGVRSTKHPNVNRHHPSN